MKQFAASFSPRPFTPQPLIRPRFRDSFDQGSFTCPDIVIACDSISASANKCGFSPLVGEDANFYTSVDYDGGGPNVGALEIPVAHTGASVSETSLWLKKTQTITGTSHPEDGLNSGCDPSDFGATHTGTLIIVEEYDPASCTVSQTSCSGSVTTTANIDPADYGFAGSPCEITYVHDCNGDHRSTTCVPDTGKQNDLCQGWEGTITLEDEYTTALLISTTEAALPAYDDDFDDLCSALRNLSEDESTYVIRRFKYKFVFPSSSGFRISWVERFAPSGGGSPTDTPKSEDILSPSTESTVYTVNEPVTNGTITIEDVTCTPL